MNAERLQRHLADYVQQVTHPSPQMAETMCERKKGVGLSWPGFDGHL